MPTSLKALALFVLGSLSRFAQSITMRAMRRTIKVRLTKELAVWLAETPGRTGFSRAKIIRNELEKAKAVAAK